MPSLKHQRALVTGATSGIGLATARALKRAGADLILLARRKDRLKAVAKELKAQAHVLDVRDRRAVDALSKKGVFDPLDILVNNAGLARGFEPLQDGHPEDWDEMLDTNVKGLLYVTRKALPGMIARGRGHVVMIGSTAGHWTYPKGNVYCASKAAVKVLTEGLRMDLLGTGVRVGTVDPGMVETEFSEVRFHGDAGKAKAVYQGMTPLTARDIANLVLFCLTRPVHVNVQQIVVMPTDQASPTLVHRRVPGVRKHLLEVLHARRPSLPVGEADRLADEAKHHSRTGRRR